MFPSKGRSFSYGKPAGMQPPIWVQPMPSDSSSSEDDEHNCVVLGPPATSSGKMAPLASSSKGERGPSTTAGQQKAPMTQKGKSRKRQKRLNPPPKGSARAKAKGQASSSSRAGPTRSSKVATGQQKEEATGSEIFQVQRILNVRPAREFLVKWEGYGPRHNSWEPEANLGNCTDLIQAYEEGQGQTPNNQNQTGGSGPTHPKQIGQVRAQVRMI